MASMRRSHAIFLALSILLIYALFFSGSGTTDFRRITEQSLARRRGVLRGGLSDADLTAKTNRELQMILEAHQQSQIFEDMPTSPGESSREHKSISYDDDGISVAGRKTMPKEKEKPRYPVDGGSSATSGAGSSAELDAKKEEVAINGNKVEKAKDQGEELAREELQAILKKSPIIIFSKSYCPYSKRAKALLLETYTISPAPYVVELDLMTSPLPKPHDADPHDESDAPTLGRKLQDILATLTGRHTVPNIMINAHSLGGSDDIASMHADGTLKEEIKRMGGNRVVSVELSKAHGHDKS